MRHVFIVVFLALLRFDCFGQNSFTAIVRDAESGEPLPGASAFLEVIGAGGVANADGMIEMKEIPDGEHQIRFSFMGYADEIVTVSFPTLLSGPFEVFLQRDEEALGEIIITSTRGTRTIADAPTRVEFMSGEELDEKGNMKPGDIRMLLNESTGIQTQQTSATSANASIRIQGLEGRYTQLLKDGFPLYAGFSGGLGLLQTPPLDLQAVEVIKGSSSTLYGGGAIAGLVNLVSRVPAEERQMRFMINGTSAKGLDISGFYSEKFRKTGLTFFAARNTNEPYAPGDATFTAIPEVERYTVHPRLFVDFSDKTKLNVDINFTTENRIGGDVKFLEGNGDSVHRYFENNDSRRYSSRFSFSHQLNASSAIHVKSSYNHFDRTIAVPQYRFAGIQESTFSEVNFTSSRAQTEWVAGLNLWTDGFSEKVFSGFFPLRDYNQATAGVFVQHTRALSEKVSLETGLRADYVVDYGLVWLPRLSLLFKAGPSFSSRIGGGFGYKAPVLFTEESERIQFRNVLPISEKNELEKSYGGNWDLNYKKQFGDIGLAINHLFFYTRLDNPLMLAQPIDGKRSFENISGFTDSKGMETNVKVTFGPFRLFIGYTLADAKIHEGSKTVRQPLTSRHRLNNVLMFEEEDKWKVGLEGYYFGPQRLSDDSIGKDYWICGFMAERLWQKFSLFINFENFLDTRQTRFDTIYTGPISNPVFRDIYAPVDGFVVNGGLKLDL